LSAKVGKFYNVLSCLCFGLGLLFRGDTIVAVLVVTRVELFVFESPFPAVT